MHQKEITKELRYILNVVDSMLYCEDWQKLDKYKWKIKFLIKDIAMEIKADGEWVNDSQTNMEYIGVCNGLNYLIDELEKIERNNNG